MISTIVHAAALLCLLASKAEAWSPSSPTPPCHHRPTFSSSPLTKHTCNNNNNIHRLTAAAVRRTNNSVMPFSQHYRSGKHVIMSATAASADSSIDCNNNNNKTGKSSSGNDDEASLVTKARDVFTRVPTLWALFCEILACQGLSTLLNVLCVTKVSEVISDDTERAGWMGKVRIYILLSTQLHLMF